MNLDTLLYRAFVLTEADYKSPGWHNEVMTGFRVSRLSGEAITRLERAANDGLLRRLLREQLPFDLYCLLVIRFTDSYERYNDAWPRVAREFAQDDRLPESIRTNPVLLRTLLGWHIRHPDIRQGKLSFTASSRSTKSRWNIACQTVADEWIGTAMDAVEKVI